MNISRFRLDLRRVCALAEGTNKQAPLIRRVAWWRRRARRAYMSRSLRPTVCRTEKEIDEDGTPA